MPADASHKWVRLGLELDPDWIYFVDAEGGVSRVQVRGQRLGRPQQVRALRLELDPEFLYVVDGDGDVARTPLAG